MPNATLSHKLPDQDALNNADEINCAQSPVYEHRSTRGMFIDTYIEQIKFDMPSRI